MLKIRQEKKQKNEMLNNNSEYSAIESDIDILCPISFTGTTANLQPDILCYF